MDWRSCVVKLENTGLWHDSNLERVNFGRLVSMAKMLCRCGNALSNSLAPNDVELRVYTDEEWDHIIQIEGKLEDLPFPKNDVWRCPSCERIYFFEGNKSIKVYALESESKSEISKGVVK